MWAGTSVASDSIAELLLSLSLRSNDINLTRSACMRQHIENHRPEKSNILPVGDNHFPSAGGRPNCSESGRTRESKLSTQRSDSWTFLSTGGHTWLPVLPVSTPVLLFLSAFIIKSDHKTIPSLGSSLYKHIHKSISLICSSNQVGVTQCDVSFHIVGLWHNSWAGACWGVCLNICREQ